MFVHPRKNTRTHLALRFDAGTGHSLGFGVIDGFEKVIEGQQSCVAEGYGFYPVNTASVARRGDNLIQGFVWRLVREVRSLEPSITFGTANALSGKALAKLRHFLYF
jgi:hypothetical protein